MTSGVTDSGVEKVKTSHGDWFSLQLYAVRTVPGFNEETANTRGEIFAFLRILMVQVIADRIEIFEKGSRKTRKLLGKMRKAAVF